jgi:XTP/dITP diphosphohydrolase
MPELVIATTNPAKADRIRWVFTSVDVALVPLPPASGAAPDEMGDSFVENARLKAQSWADRLQAAVVATDGGLLIPALGEQWSPLRTARAAGPGLTGLERARHLLHLARDLRGPERAVSWLEALAIARPDGAVLCFESDGTAANLATELDEQRFEPSFWAASLCRVPGRDQTLAELAAADLPATDPTWQGLRDQVERYIASGQAHLDGFDLRLR